MHVLLCLVVHSVTICCGANIRRCSHIRSRSGLVGGRGDKPAERHP